MAKSVRDANSIRDRENEIVFAGERAARGQAHTQELIIAAIHFEQFTGAAVDLLANRAPKFHLMSLAFSIGTEADGFRAKRKDDGAGLFFQWPTQDAASGDAAADFSAQQICLPDELRCVSRRGVRIDFA